MYSSISSGTTLTQVTYNIHGTQFYIRTTVEILGSVGTPPLYLGRREVQFQISVRRLTVLINKSVVILSVYRQSHDKALH